MEPIGLNLEGQWSSLGGFFTSEEVDFMANVSDNSCFDSGFCSLREVPSCFWSNYDSGMEMANSTNNFSQGSSSCSAGGSSFLFPTSSQESYYLRDSHPVLINSNSSPSMDFCIGDVTNTASYLVEGDDCSNQEMRNGNVEESGGNQQPEAEVAALPDDKNFLPKREQVMPAPEPLIEDKSNSPLVVSKKRSQSKGDAQKNKRNVRSKKSQKIALSSNNEEENNARLNAPATSSCCSEDNLDISLEFNGGVSSSLCSKGAAALKLNGKTRASRGAATDPQSLYARKRRERINERLRILQNLVPNRTKVDISTVLEEAVHYVKFLQLQIKLLSSDDLWMYAPIAYNGMDLGLDLKLNKPR